MNYCHFSVTQVDQDLVITLASGWLLHSLMCVCGGGGSMPLIPAPWSHRQVVVCEFKASQGYTMRPSLKKLYIHIQNSES